MPFPLCLFQNICENPLDSPDSARNCEGAHFQRQISSVSNTPGIMRQSKVYEKFQYFSAVIPSRKIIFQLVTVKKGFHFYSQKFPIWVSIVINVNIKLISFYKVLLSLKIVRPLVKSRKNYKGKTISSKFPHSILYQKEKGQVVPFSWIFMVYFRFEK